MNETRKGAENADIFDADLVALVRFPARESRCVMSLDTAAWDWPQWTFVALALFNVVCVGFLHGTPRKNWNIGYSLFDFVAVMFLLVAGGFFS